MQKQVEKIQEYKERDELDKYYDEIREEFSRGQVEFSKLVLTPSPLFK